MFCQRKVKKLWIDDEKLPDKSFFICTFPDKEYKGLPLLKVMLVKSKFETTCRIYNTRNIWNKQILGIMLNWEVNRINQTSYFECI